MPMARQKMTRALLLAGTVIPFSFLGAPSSAAPLEAGNTLLAQQQEPAEKSDRPDRRRPEGAPEQPGARPPQKSQPPAARPEAPPAKQVQPPAPPAQVAPPAKRAEPPTQPAP